MSQAMLPLMKSPMQTAQDVARHDQAPPARVERSISTSVKALTMALLLVFAPLSAAGSTRDNHVHEPDRSSYSVREDRPHYLEEVTRSFEVSLQLQLSPEKTAELAYALNWHGNALAELLQRNLPSVSLNSCEWSTFECRSQHMAQSTVLHTLKSADRQRQ
jgi:hypothetical protein